MPFVHKVQTVIIADKYVLVKYYYTGLLACVVLRVVRTAPGAFHLGSPQNIRTAAKAALTRGLLPEHKFDAAGRTKCSVYNI